MPYHRSIAIQNLLENTKVSLKISMDVNQLAKENIYDVFIKDHLSTSCFQNQPWPGLHGWLRILMRFVDIILYVWNIKKQNLCFAICFRSKLLGHVRNTSLDVLFSWLPLGLMQAMEKIMS